MPRTAEIAATVALAVACLTAVGAQQAAPAPFARTERFVGRLTLQRPQPHEVSASMHQWIVRGRQKIAALELPMRGTMIVHLRAGSLATLIDGRRQERAEGEFWIVPAGSTLGLETQDDSAIIQTIILSDER